MKYSAFFCILSSISCMWMAEYAHAQLPQPERSVQNAGVHSGMIALTNTELDLLHAKLSQHVFIVYAHQERAHELTADDVVYDGAAAAVRLEDIREILPKDADISETDEPPENQRPSGASHAFFTSDLASVSSPFHRREKKKKVLQSSRQYYLTTADWLTKSKKIEIVIEGRKIPALIDFRDDAQNVAILSTRSYAGVVGAAVFPASEPIPGAVYIMLNPGTMYERVSQHNIHVSEQNRYGQVNASARNGYPFFTSDGRLVGLCVRPDLGQTSAQAIHPGLLSRALHPSEYSRVKVEDIEAVRY